MADESCAFPGGSPDRFRTPGRWLDRATAERLLSGAPLEALGLDSTHADPATAAEAARLAQALQALQALAGDARTTEAGHQGADAAPGARPDAHPGAGAGASAASGVVRGEPAGETAALAAFRQARETAWVHNGDRAGSGRRAGDGTLVRDGGWAGDGGSARGPGGERATAHGAGATGEPAGAVAAVEIGAVHLGGPGDESGRHSTGHPDATRVDPTRRPVRFGLVAALAACMLGGVTVAAATTGILPSPFGGSRPSPTVSVSEAVTPAHPAAPRLSPSPSAGGSSTATGDPTGEASRGGRATPGSPTGHPGTGGHSGSETSENWWASMISACQDYRGGQDLDDKTEQRLEDAAKGAGRVESFCDSLLGEEGVAPGTAGDSGGTSVNGGESSSPETSESSSEPTGSGVSSGGDGSGAPGSGSAGPSPSPSGTAPDPSQTSGGVPGVTVSTPPAQ